MNSKYRLIIIMIMFLSLSFFMCLADEDVVSLFKPQVKTLAVFKNGLGFFVREGEASLKNGWTETEMVPNASLGSMWVALYDKDAELDSVIGYKETITKKIEASDLSQLLMANIGKKVSVRYNNETIEGVIKSIPGAVPAKKISLPRYDMAMYSSRSYSDSSEYAESPAPPSASIIIIDTNTGAVAVPLNGITRIGFPDSYSSELVRSEQIKKIRFKIESEKQNVKMSVSYLEKGISWVPGYLVDIRDPLTARITMNATLINDAEDIENAELHFVVGYPNFMFANVTSPLALDTSLAQFIASLSGEGETPRTYGAMSNIMTQSTTFERDRTNTRDDYSVGEMKGLGGEGEEDLFFYDKKNVSIRKGERAYFNIFSDTVKYKHLYEWDIPELSHIDMYGRPENKGQAEQREQVWHAIKLTNSTNYPWTTAPAMTVNDWKPLAQDKINYTPKGATTSLKLTVAPDIKVDRNEYELTRVLTRVADDDFDLITIKGELYIKNFKSQDIVMEITKQINGEVIIAGNNGIVKKTVRQLAAVNPNSNISWELPLKAGEEITVMYKYKIYKSR